MKRLILLLALGASAPALAQHQGHDGHQQQQAEPAPASKPADPHASHSAPAADPDAGHAAPAEAPPVAPPPAAASLGPAHAADAVYGAAEMERSRVGMREEHGGHETRKILIDQLEYTGRNGRDGFAWDAQAWYGGDIDKLWLKSEGEGAFGEGLERGEVQALWSRAIDPWFDLQLGLRQDFGRGPERTHLVLGVQGLAPFWFEVDAAAFVSTRGDVTARVEAEYDLRLTQRLILQPAAELEFSLQDVPELGIGSGLSSAEAGLRLRFEIEPEFAPYVGVEYERGFGDTARFRRAAGEEAGRWSLLAGLRAWF